MDINILGGGVGGGEGVSINFLLCNYNQDYISRSFILP